MFLPFPSDIPGKKSLCALQPPVEFDRRTAQGEVAHELGLEKEIPPLHVRTVSNRRLAVQGLVGD